MRTGHIDACTGGDHAVVLQHDGELVLDAHGARVGIIHRVMMITVRGHVTIRRADGIRNAVELGLAESKA